MFFRNLGNKKSQNTIGFDQGSGPNSDSEVYLLDSKVEIKSDNIVDRGTRNFKDLLAASGINRANEEYLVVNGKYTRSFVLNGFPAHVSTGWLDSLYSYDGDMDTMVYIEPVDEKTAIKDLTKKITQYTAQLETEHEKGSIAHITDLENKIRQLVEQRQQLELNYENMYQICVLITLFCDTEKDLIRESKIIENRLSGHRMKLMPLSLRQDEGYKSVLPTAVNYVPDFYRNFSTGGLTTCFPFYNGSLSHRNGTLIGVNMSTMTPAFIDFYNKKILDNANISVFGKAGSGKTYFVSCLIMRSALEGIRSVIIDPEGEYANPSKAVGGVSIRIAPGENSLNPFDIEAEEVLDRDGNGTGKFVVELKQKVSDVLNLVAMMVGKLLMPENKGIVADCIRLLYANLGINERPESLIESKSRFDEESGEMVYGIRKKMPQLSDLYNSLISYADKNNDLSVKKLANALKIYVKGGIYDLFDCQTSDGVNMSLAPIVNFDISELEEKELRPIGMYVAMEWAWEKFAKHNPTVRKRIVCDEAWLLTNPSLAGSEYTASFLENCARRIRKRNGGLLVASQGFREFASSSKGLAVLTNTTVRIFLKQDPSDIEAVQDTFKLSNGEKNYLIGAKKGEMLVKINNESSRIFAYSFNFEHEIVNRKFLEK